MMAKAFSDPTTTTENVQTSRAIETGDHQWFLITAGDFAAGAFDPARFLDPTIDRNYPDKDYHRMYFGEIVTVAGTAKYRCS